MWSRLREKIAARIRLLRMVPRAGAGLSALLIALQLGRATVPTVQAVAVGGLVAALGPAGLDRRVLLAAGLVAGLFLFDQLIWLVLTPVVVLVSRRIDGSQRARLRRLAIRLPGLDKLESQEFQDRASRAVDSGMGIARERSAGTAATGQLELVFRMLSALVAAGLLATFSPVLALCLLVVSLAIRAILRRQWLRIIDRLDADTAGQRREYYLSEQAVIGAAKDVGCSGSAAGSAAASARPSRARTRRSTARCWACCGGSGGSPC